MLGHTCARTHTHTHGHTHLSLQCAATTTTSCDDDEDDEGLPNCAWVLTHPQLQALVRGYCAPISHSCGGVAIELRQRHSPNRGRDAYPLAALNHQIQGHSSNSGCPNTMFQLPKELLLCTTRLFQQRDFMGPEQRSTLQSGNEEAIVSIGQSCRANHFLQSNSLSEQAGWPSVRLESRAARKHNTW